MKKLLFLFLLPVVFSFSMPPVLVDDKKNDWVYEVNKPIVNPAVSAPFVKASKKQDIGINVIYCHYYSPCSSGRVDALVRADSYPGYNKMFKITISWSNGLGSVATGYIPPNGDECYMFMYTTSYNCAVGITGYSVAWYVGD